MTPEMMDQNNLSKDDLFLLMESYKNTIQMQTTLLERQTIIAGKIDTLIETNKNISEALKEAGKNFNESVIEVTAKLAPLSSIEASLKDATTKLSNVANLETNIKNEITTKLSGTVLDYTKQHNTIRNQLYGALVGMVVMVVSLIGMVVNVFDKLRISTENHQLLHKIIEHLGIKLSGG